MTPRRRRGSARAREFGEPRSRRLLAIVAAVASNGVIGDANRLPWRLPADLRHFRALTTGHAVIMGRRTWDSIGRALPDRQNIVVTRQRGVPRSRAPRSRIRCADALARVRLPAPAFCIGGGELYRDALPHATTHVPDRDRPRLSTATRPFRRSTAASGARSRASRTSTPTASPTRS